MPPAWACSTLPAVSLNWTALTTLTVAARATSADRETPSTVPSARAAATSAENLVFLRIVDLQAPTLQQALRDCSRTADPLADDRRFGQLPIQYHNCGRKGRRGTGTSETRLFDD